MDGSNVTYLHADQTGSTILITDSAGTPTQRNVYTPWGDLASGSLGSIPVGFTGQFYEPEVDLYYYKSRHYSPALGRFLQPDLAGYDGGLNLYEYAASEPVNLTDPLGFKPFPPFIYVPPPERGPGGFFFPFGGPNFVPFYGGLPIIPIGPGIGVIPGIGIVPLPQAPAPAPAPAAPPPPPPPPKYLKQSADIAGAVIGGLKLALGA